MKVRNIVFDLGNVLNICDLDFALKGLSAGSNASIEEVRAFLFDTDFVDRLDSGFISNEEFHTAVQSGLGWREDLEALRKLWEDMLSTDHEMVELMVRLKSEGYRIYVLSNINPIHLDLANRSFDFLQHTDGAIYSCECGMIKPDESIFQHLLNTFGLNAAETIFIDDRQVNVDAAGKLGITSIVHRSYIETREKLSEWIPTLR